MARPSGTLPDGVRKPPAGPKLSGLLAPYRWQILLLVALTVASSAVGLFVPQVIAHAIDGFTAGQLDMASTVTWLLTLMVAAFVLGSLQVVVQTVTSERVARDLRTRLAGMIAQQDLRLCRGPDAGAAADQPHLRRRRHQDLRLPGGRLADLVGLPDHRRQRAAAAG